MITTITAKALNELTHKITRLEAQNADLLAALTTIKHTLARGRNVGEILLDAYLDAEEIARATIERAKP